MTDSTNEVRIVPLPQAQDVLTDILRQGAQQLLAQAFEAEVADWIDRRHDCRDAAGRRQAVRNGHLPERTITTGVGPVTVQQPRVHDRRPAALREKFSLAILPPYQRKTKSIYETGVRVTKSAFHPIAARLARSDTLPKWSLVIQPASR